MKPPPKGGGNSPFEDDREGEVDEHCDCEDGAAYDHDGFADLVGADVPQFGGGLGRLDVGGNLDGDLEGKEQGNEFVGGVVLDNDFAIGHADGVAVIVAAFDHGNGCVILGGVELYPELVGTWVVEVGHGQLKIKN